MSDDPSKLVSTAWLARRLGETRVIDASWYLPDMGRDARAEYEAAHIPGARFLDLEEVSDPDATLPHMAPSEARFRSRMRSLGVGDAANVVVYDGAEGGMLSAARVWWLMRTYGLQAAVLDGGLAKWRAEGRPITSETPPPRERHVTLSRDPSALRDVTEVARAVKLNEAQIVDARSGPRFRGEAAEPRPGLRAGHIPGARNVPYSKLFRPDGTMKDGADLAQVFIAAGVDLNRPVITSCGSGVTAAVLNLALARLGHGDHTLYDGSWAEWGGYPDLRVETGEAS